VGYANSWVDSLHGSYRGWVFKKGLKNKKKHKESRATMLSIVESQWKASMEDNCNMGTKVDFVESKVVAMSKSIFIIKDLLLQKRNKSKGCKLVTLNDPPPSDVPQKVATSLVKGIALKEIATILSPRVETIKPTPLL